jgi:ABC-type transport system involved in multi-copper enzyme maturation permease subunit
MLATVAMTQGMVANEISQGTAAWVVAKPVARPAFVLSKFVALVPVVIVAMVAIPGLVARWLFRVAESEGRTDFDAQDLLRLLEEPSSRTVYKPLMDLNVYLGILTLMIVLILLVAAAMILLGCLLRHATAILAVGLMVPIALLILANVNIEHQIVSLTPAWAMESFIDSIGGNQVSVLGPALVAALWTAGLLGVATWWFNRREL